MVVFEVGDFDRIFIIFNLLMIVGGVGDINVLFLFVCIFQKVGMLMEVVEVLECVVQCEILYVFVFLFNVMQFYEEVGQCEKVFLFLLQFNKVILEYQDVVYILIKGFLECGEKEFVEVYKG